MRLDVIVATWAPGGNLPPLLGVAALLRARRHRVRVLASPATSAAARAAGFETLEYRRAPQPDPAIPFEAQAERVMREIAGTAIACDVHDLLVETSPICLSPTACCRQRLRPPKRPRRERCRSFTSSTGPPVRRWQQSAAAGQRTS